MALWQKLKSMLENRRMNKAYSRFEMDMIRLCGIRGAIAGESRYWDVFLNLWVSAHSSRGYQLFEEEVNNAARYLALTCENYHEYSDFEYRIREALLKALR